MRRVLGVAAAVAAGVIVACKSGDKTIGPGGTGPLKSIVITPDTATLAVAGSRNFSASGLDAQGRTIGGLSFFWSSKADTLATVTQAGVVTAVKTGSVQIAASAQGKSGFATLTVVAKPVGSVVVTPQNATIRAATTLQLRDTVRDVSGAIVTNVPVTWSSDSAPLVSVDQNGLVTGRQLGTAHITASAGGKSAVAAITVSTVPVRFVIIQPSSPVVSVGQTTQLTAITQDSAHGVLAGRVVRWSSQNSGVATIDSISGLLTGITQGTSVITATSEGVNGTTPATVNPAPVNSVVLSPAVTQLHVGQTSQLTATVTDVNGQPVSGATVTFSSNNTNIAAVASLTSTTAQVTAGPSTGSATITGTSGSKTGQATVLVTQVPVDSVNVTASHLSLTVGRQDTLTATAFDSAGNPLPGRPVAWKSGSPTIASVNSAGIVQTLKPGTVVVFATISGVQGSVVLQVNPVPVGSVKIAPNADTVLQGGQQQLTVVVKDSLGNVIGSPQVTWVSRNGGGSGDNIATVNVNGLVTGVSPGTVQIVAQSGSVADTNTTVVLQPAATVTVTPSATTLNLALKRTVQLTATLKDQNNNVLTGRTVTWSSSNNAKAMVSSSGLVTPADTGAVTITATAVQPSGNVSGTATVTTTNPVAKVVVSPTPDTIYATAPANTVQLSDVTSDSANTAVTGRPVTWAPTSGGVATTNVSGLVTATNTAAGSATITATSPDGPSGSASVVVFGHSNTVTVMPGSATLDSSGLPFPSSARDSAQILDTFGTDVSSRIVTWTSSDPATVTINGSASAIGPGNVAVTVQVISTKSLSVTITATVTDGTSGATAVGSQTLTIGP